MCLGQVMLLETIKKKLALVAFHSMVEIHLKTAFDLIVHSFQKRVPLNRSKLSKEVRRSYTEMWHQEEY